MGKPTMDQCEGSINHFSHQHPLQLFNLSTFQVPTHVTCSGCHDSGSGSMYTCSICNYHLHKKCSEMPQKITHPFDQEHVLCLLEKPKYPEGIFNCDACGKKGGGFSYHCEPCGTDLHILCASLPIHFNHHCHTHQLTLTFAPAYPKKSFHCGICQCAGSNVWFYRCSGGCEFDVHLSCVSAFRKPQLQHATSSMATYMSIQNPFPQQFGQLSTGQAQNQSPHVMGMPYTSPRPQMMTPTPTPTPTPTLPQNNFMINPASNPALGNSFQSIIAQQQQQQQMVQQAFAQQQQAIANQQAMLQQHLLAQKQAVMPQQMIPQQPQPMMMYNPMMAQPQGGDMLMNSLVNGLASGFSQAATDALLQGITGGGGGDPGGYGNMDGSGGGDYTA